MSVNDIALIYAKLDALVTLLEERARSDLAARATDRVRIRRLELRVEGPDEAPEKGVVVRLDRVEQWKGRAQRMLWILAGSAATIFIDRLFRILS